MVCDEGGLKMSEQSGMPCFLYQMTKEERNRFDIRTTNGITTIHLKNITLSDRIKIVLYGFYCFLCGCYK